MARAAIGSAPFKGTPTPPQTHQQLETATTAAGGIDYEPGDTITLAGGTATTPATLTVVQIQFTDFTIANPGTGYTVGDGIIVSLDGADATWEVAEIDVNGAVVSLTPFAPGNTNEPTANPYTPSGGTGTGLQINLLLPTIAAVAIDEPGNYTATPADPVGQAATSGTGTGANFTCTWVPI